LKFHFISVGVSFNHMKMIQDKINGRNQTSDLIPNTYPRPTHVTILHVIHLSNYMRGHQNFLRKKTLICFLNMSWIGAYSSMDTCCLACNPFSFAFTTGGVGYLIWFRLWVKELAFLSSNLDERIYINVSSNICHSFFLHHF